MTCMFRSILVTTHIIYQVKWWSVAFHKKFKSLTNHAMIHGDNFCVTLKAFDKSPLFDLLFEVRHFVNKTPVKPGASLQTAVSLINSLIHRVIHSFPPTALLRCHAQTEIALHDMKWTMFNWFRPL